MNHNIYFYYDLSLPNEKDSFNKSLGTPMYVSPCVGATLTKVFFTPGLGYGYPEPPGHLPR